MNIAVNKTSAICSFAFAILTPTLAMPQVQTFRLLASDGVAGVRFGDSVAISGNHALVGSDFDHPGWYLSGSAYLFDVSTGQELMKLVPSDPWDWDQFGYSVAIDGNRTVIGAFNNGDNGIASGSAYIHNVVSGLQLFKLVPADNTAGDIFGVSVAISGNYAVIGAPGDTVNGTASGSAYVYNVTLGQELHKLVPSDGAQDNNFGCSVGVSGDLAVIGAFYDDDMGWLSGSAYVFNIATGQELFKLLATDGAAGDYFGCQVDIDGNNAVIGAYQDDDNGSESGAAYLFDATTGEQLHKLVPDQGAVGDNFGFDVAISGELAVIGAIGNGTPSCNEGCGYVFDVTTGQELAQLFATEGECPDQLGWRVGVSEGQAILGAPMWTYQTGAAYLFDLIPRGTGFCFGDAGSGTPCPCANDNDGTVPGSGCANGAFVSGAQLTGDGLPSVSADTLILTTTGLDPHNSGLYFQANNAVNEGNGSLFGDGPRCAGGGLIRLQVRTANSSGVSSTTISIGSKGGVAPGNTKRYQCWYRDTSGGQPCGIGTHDFNLSNGYEITWRP